MKPCYRIKNWNQIYENNRTRELKKLQWIPIPVKLDGDGYTNIMSDENGQPRKNGPAIFGTFISVLEVAASCDNIALRGTLIRSSGEPHDYASLARITRIPIKNIEDMILFCTVSLNWIEIIDLETGAGMSHDSAAPVPILPILSMSSIPSLKRAKRSNFPEFKPPTIDEVKVYFKENEYPETLAEKFFRGYDAAGWKDSEGKPVRSWKQKAQHVWFKPEEKKTSKVYDREARLKEMESWHEQKSV